MSWVERYGQSKLEVAMDKYALHITLGIMFVIMLVMNSGCDPFFMQDVTS